jgi:thiol-disulfide isomerase/thioredoxin
VLLVGVAALVVALGACGSGSGGSSSAKALPNRSVVPLAGGAAVPVRSLTGPAVINLWATWCGPCRAELPAFQQVHQQFGDRLHVVGVNQGDAGEKVSSYLAGIGVDFPQYLDADGGVGEAFGVTGLPATLVVDASGHVIDVHSGALTADSLRALVRTDLGIA